MFDRLTFEVDNQEEFNSDLTALAFALTSNDIIFEDAERLFYEIMGEQFESEGGRSGGWTPLALNYSRRKAITHPGRPILQRDLLLVRSLTQRGAAYSLRVPRRDSMTWGTTRPGALAHHRGAPAAHLPQRRIIAFNATDKLRFLQIVVNRTTERAREAGYGVERV